MTLQEHIVTAKRLVKVRKDLMAMYCVGSKKFKKLTSSEADRLYKVVRLIDWVKCVLDDSYHRLIDEKTFQKLGHIYYGGK